MSSDIRRDMGIGTVLVITREFDVTADYVIMRLAEFGTSVVRFDLADFPEHVAVSATAGPAGWGGTLATHDRIVDLADVGAVWYRKPTDFRFRTGDDAARR